MTPILRFLLLLMLFLGVQSCGSSGSHRPQHDIYRVDVRTHLNIRDTPSRRGNVIGYVRNGELIEVLEVNDGWASIEYADGRTGYVASDYLVLVRQYSREEEPAPDADPQLAENESPSLSNESGKSAPASGVRAGGNVFFIGDSTILSDYDRSRISESLKNAGEYQFIVNTVENVASGELFDYAPDLLDNLSEELDSSMNWWQRFKSWFGGDSPSSNIVLLSYIRSVELLQAECNGTSLKYLKMSEPKEYFDRQAAARYNPVGAIVDLGLAIDRAGAEYKTRNWFVRGQVNTGNIFENICEDWIVENILPRDSFWHKWVLGWIFAVPFKIANWLFVLTGSYLMTLVLLMVVILALYSFGQHGVFKTRRLGAEKVGCFGTVLPLLSILANFILWLSMLSMLVYMIPEMATLSVMSQTGYSEKVVETAMHSFENYAVTKNWFLVIMFLVGLVLSTGLNAGYALNATLPSRMQKALYERNKENIKNAKMLAGDTLDDDKLSASPTPYLELLTDSMSSDNVGKALGPAIPLSFVFNGAFLLFASLFYWTKTLKRLLVILFGVISYRKQGLY